MDENIFDFILGAETTKGGAGSGHFGHAGRPGKRGGSAPEGGSPKGGGGDDKKKISEPAEKYNGEAFRSMSVPDRKEAWEKIEQSRRDSIANAKESILAREAEILKGIGDRPKSGYIDKDVSERLHQARELVPIENAKLIENTALELSGVLEVAGVNKKIADELVMESVDVLIAQDFESAARQLGDHGIHHIKGDIDAAVEVLNQVPGADTPKDIASAYIAGIYHDTGYMTPPSRDFLDEGHPRWSAEHYNTYIRERVSKGFDERTADNISHMIRTHAATDIDWKGDAVASAFRVADNIALFQEEKLPPLFRFVPETLDMLEAFAAGKLSLSAMTSKMKAAINGTEYSDKIKNNLIKAVLEVNPITPKLTLGMLGGNLDSIEWVTDHIKINLRRNKDADRLQKLIDVGQKQFGKLAKTYGVDPDQFLKDLNFSFADSKGNTLLEGRIVGEKELQQIIENAIYKELDKIDINAYVAKSLKKN